MRLHPSAALPLERSVPPSGAQIGGYHLPAGTNVGISAHLIHQRPDIYGEDAGEYRPERWLDGDLSATKSMERHFFVVRAFLFSFFFSTRSTRSLRERENNNNKKIVRQRQPCVHRETPCGTRDGQVGGPSAPALRGGVGIGRSGMEAQELLVSRARGVDCAVQVSKRKEGRRMNE